MVIVTGGFAPELVSLVSDPQIPLWLLLSGRVPDHCLGSAPTPHAWPSLQNFREQWGRGQAALASVRSLQEKSNTVHCNVHLYSQIIGKLPGRLLNIP